MSDEYDRLVRLHGTLIGGAPQDSVDRLYKAFPSVLGFSSKQTDRIMFEAVLILALHQAGTTRKVLHKVYFLTPPSLADGWVLTEFRSSAKRIFARLKTGKSVLAVKHVGELFHQVMMGSQVFALPKEPDRWVAFGFSRSDSIPDWMRPKLGLEIEPERDLHPGV